MKFKRAYAGRYTAEADVDCNGTVRNVEFAVRKVEVEGLAYWTVEAEFVMTEDDDRVVQLSECGDVVVDTYREAKVSAETMAAKGWARHPGLGWCCRA